VVLELESLGLPVLEDDSSLVQSLGRDPLPYFPAYCLLARLYEDHEFPVFNCIPLRKSRIQSSVIMDTRIFWTHVLGRSGLPPRLTTRIKQRLWGKVFDLRSQAFRSRSGMNFDGTITTDGMSVSVHLSSPSAVRAGGQRKTSGKEPDYMKQMREQALYIDVERNLQACRDRGSDVNIVVIDPNKRDLLYCQGQMEGGERNFFRYTANQRAREIGTRRFEKERRKLKKQTKGVARVERTLARHSHKTMKLDNFVKYLIARKMADRRLSTFYEKPIHRKWRWWTYINRQKSESKLLSYMRSRMDGRFIVVMGDWSDAGRSMRFHASTKTKGWR
jgi:hypothetical protein